MGFLRPKGRAGVLWRAFAAAFVLVGCGAATTAVAGLLQVHQLVQDITVGGNKGVKVKGIDLPSPGKPQTILLIGSDHRADAASFRQANTDTILLMRLNASSGTVNVLSIPRDLQVQVPGYGSQKINAAYSEGGYNLLLQTIKSQVFPDLKVNHIIDTNFTGFSDIIDAIGCVYSDVDHRYYNDTALTGYSSIDIQPGYQRLCGDNQSEQGALPFVRFRHTDSDIVRNARQQDFLRWAKDGYSQSQLLHDRDKLLKIIGRHSTTDRALKTTKGLLELFDLVVTADGSQIKQIRFPSTFSNTATGDYVLSTAAGEQQAYASFMKPTKSSAPSAPAPAAGSTSGKRRRRRPAIDVAGLTADPTDGHSQAAALSRVGMPVYYPRLIKSGSAYCSSLTANCNPGDEPGAEYAHSYPRQYLIPTRGSGHKVHAYRMTLYINSQEGKYYGIQGVHWRNPPLLASPSGTRTINGRKLYLYADGGDLTTVAWHLGANTYWVSNDLTSDIPNSQLVGIAASMVRWR